MDERRQQQRYPILGLVHMTTARGKFISEIFDVSLNGALLLRAADAELTVGETVEVELAMRDLPEMIAKARVAHIQDDRVGVEFQDMGTRDFDAFSGMILMLAQQARPSWNS